MGHYAPPNTESMRAAVRRSRFPTRSGLSLNIPEMTGRIIQHRSGNTGRPATECRYIEKAQAWPLLRELETIANDEDNALGKLPDARYRALDAQYAKEQDALEIEVAELKRLLLATNRAGRRNL